MKKVKGVEDDEYDLLSDDYDSEKDNEEVEFWFLLVNLVVFSALFFFVDFNSDLIWNMNIIKSFGFCNFSIKLWPSYFIFILLLFIPDIVGHGHGHENF